MTGPAFERCATWPLFEHCGNCDGKGGRAYPPATCIDCAGTGRRVMVDAPIKLVLCGSCRKRGPVLIAAGGHRCAACGENPYRWPHPAFERLA